MISPRHPNALPSGYKLHWYVLGSVIGQGGFGITYHALDTNLDQRVAIKEFLPVELAARGKETLVRALCAEHADAYRGGLKRFVTEACTLARFRHPNVARVLSVFEANNTAYMVMEYEGGESLEDVFQTQRLATESALFALLEPLLDGLKVVHDAGFIHRDIKPDNIHLREDGTPVLLDFGSARRAVGVATRTLTALVTPGYSPFEQYDATPMGEQKQGPWTDIYALGATLYRAVMGHAPPDAMARVNSVMAGHDALVPASEVVEDQYSHRLVAGIDWALEFLPENRPQSIGEWRRTLCDGEPAPERKPSATLRPARKVTQAAPLPGPSAPLEAIIRAPARPSGPVRSVFSTPGATSGPMLSGRDAVADASGGGEAAVDVHKRPGTMRRLAEAFVVLSLVAAFGAWYLMTPAPIAVPMPRPHDANAVIETSEQRAEREARWLAELERRHAEAESARRRAQIDRLLEQAGDDIAADQLTTPPDGNAFSRYRQVLVLDPGNASATAGLQSIRARYLALSAAASKQHSFELARHYLDEAGSVSPGAESVAAARLALSRRVEEFEREAADRSIDARRVAVAERERLKTARRATEAERQRMRTARLAAEQELERLQAEIGRKRLAEEAEIRERLEADFATAQEIARLLVAAQDDMDAQRLIAPQGGNAMHRYRAVLDIDPKNNEARAGLERIAEHYVQLANDEISAYRFESAATHLEQASRADSSSKRIASAREILRAGVAAYDGSHPIRIPPYRITFVPVAGRHTCSGEDPQPWIEAFGHEFLMEDADVDYVPTSTDVDSLWIASGVRKRPRVEQLYALGKQLKLDGALMYWYSAVGTQCVKTHIEAYLVDIQAKKVYLRKGSEPNLEDVTAALLDTFEKGRRDNP